MSRSHLFVLWAAALSHCCWLVAAQEPSIMSINPRIGSINGGVRITLNGNAFSNDQFNYGEGNEDKGNYVTFVSETRSYICDMHRDGNTRRMVTCYTRAMVPDTYKVQLKVDGTPMAEDRYCEEYPFRCYFEANMEYTPTIEVIQPHAAPPGTVITLGGRIFTTFFGSNILTANSTNGVLSHLLRVFMGGLNCELLDENREVRELVLDGPEGESEYGHMKCVVASGYIGAMNASYIVEEPYGRSKPQMSLMRVLSTDKIGMFEQYPVIDSVTPARGSTAGGAFFTINGRGLNDRTVAPPSVSIADAPCEVQADMTTDETLVCLTPQEPDQLPNYFAGNRGLQFDRWVGVSMEFDSLPDIRSLTSGSPGYQSDLVDDATMTTEEEQVTRIHGYVKVPEDGDYMFILAGNKTARFSFSQSGNPSDKVEVAHIENVTDSWYDVPGQFSPRYTLSSTKAYYIEVLHSTGVAEAGGSVTLGMKRFRSPFTRGATGWAHNDVQNLTVSSSVRSHVLSLSLSGWPTTRSQGDEVQVVTVEAADSRDTFRLVMHGASTGLLMAKDSASSVRKALENLPTIPAGGVTVSKSTSGTTYTFTVTFTSGLGRWPILEAIVPDDSGATVTATRTTAGITTRDTFQLQMGDHVTPPIPRSPTESQIQNAMSQMLTVRCPDGLLNPSAAHAYAENFEVDRGQGFLETGTRDDQDEAFCGRRALKDGPTIYQTGKVRSEYGSPVSLVTNNWLCFAYKGVFRQMLRLIYKHVEGSTLVTSKANFDVELKSDYQWHYDCFDALSLVRSVTSNAGGVYLQEALVFRDKRDSQPTYIDMVYIGTAPVVTDYKDLENQRVLPPVRVSSVAVTETQTNEFRIEFAPLECQTPDVLTIRNALSQHYSVAVQQSGSTGTGGTFSVSWSGSQSVVLSAWANALDVQTMLESLPGMGKLSVLRAGDCAGYTWRVDWLTKGGEQPLLQVDGSQLTGLDVQMAVVRAQSGGIFYRPIPGHLLRTHHNVPQVTLKVNNVPAECRGSCNYEWDSQLTPHVTSVSPISGTLGTVVTVHGDNFATRAVDNVFKVGQTSCDVTSASETSFQCTLGGGFAGVSDVWVSVRGKGMATFTGSAIRFTYDASISGLQPTSGGLGGGVRLTLTGTGFKETATVTVAGASCEVGDVSATQLICIAPNAANGAGSAAVELTQDGASITSGTDFTYDVTLTPVINTASLTQASAAGGEPLVITGHGFGASPAARRAMHVGDTLLEIVSYSDTEVTFTLPPLPHGNHDVKIFVAGKGYASYSDGSLPTIRVIFKVTDVDLGETSAFGGGRAIITGERFPSDPSVLQVSFGHVTSDVISVTDTRAEVLLGTSGKLWRVTNMGQHPVWKEGYAWDPETLTVEDGDTVEWRWESPGSVLDVPRYKVEQTANPDSMVYDGQGFRSAETGTTSGVYRYTFGRTGVFHYWSGPVNSYQDIILRGVVQVVPKASFVSHMTMTVNGIEPRYVTGSRRRRRSTSCPVIKTPGCVDPVVTPGNTFAVGFSQCLFAEVTGFTPSEGSGSTSLTFTGSGFGSDPDCVEVLIGGVSIPVTSVDDSNVVARVTPSLELSVFVAYPVEVRVSGVGLAVNRQGDETQRRFMALTRVDNIQPSPGSLAGGTRLTLTGSGFKDEREGSDEIQVVIDGTLCPVESHTYTRVICLTEARPSEITADVMVGVKGYQATCADCVYDYAMSGTPELTSVTPSQASGPSSLTLSGTRFGNSPQAVTVTVGGIPCVVTSVSNTQIRCDVGLLPAGSNVISLVINPLGVALHAGEVFVTGAAFISAMSPTEGSFAGGTRLTLTGTGFVSGDTQVRVAGADCVIAATEDVSLSRIVCMTPEHDIGNANVVVTSKGVTYASQQFTYSQAATPAVTSASSLSGVPGDVITLTGSGFNGVMDEDLVVVGGVGWEVVSTAPTSITCVVGNGMAGVYHIDVYVLGKGLADTRRRFTYLVNLDNVSPSRGSYGGGQPVTVNGQGLHLDATVSLCGLPGVTVSGSPSKIVFLTPENPGNLGTVTCDLSVTIGKVTEILANAFTYDVTRTPVIASLTPERGGTAGGTQLTIQGTNFGADIDAVSVEIDGVSCEMKRISDVEIVCETGIHPRNIKTEVVVHVGTNGVARNDGHEFWYIDRWSSIFTWGGTSLPEEGDIVVVPAGMTLLLDTDTPVLKMLLIQGGTLMFDEADVELRAENILIMDDGLLQVGTEDEPFQHKAIITLHGQLRAPELPIYGAKTLAVRHGRLELHGQNKGVTWTRLSHTASAGDTILRLETPISWLPGDEIIVATTGGHVSFTETEKLTITAVSADGREVTVSQALHHDHLGITQTAGGVVVETRAEVGLLTHNIVVRGNVDAQWSDDIPPCPERFENSEFATQNCRQGRAGEDIGSSQFGAAIMFHQRQLDAGQVQCHMEHVEVTFAGQAFRLGRYPIHFHINGDMSGSYVRGCAVHHTFNRAINVHNTNNLLIEHNVVYDVMGGAIFLEDSIERGNVFQYNFVAYVIASTSLLNDDVTPAAFWITHPDNVIRHNAVAGGTHFGFWYRMHEHPQGPSFDIDICPRNEPLGEFYNNTVHSCGWYGLWIFEIYDPKVGGGCDAVEPEPAIFRKFTAWNNRRGAEYVECGAIQFHEFVLANNFLAGFEHFHLHTYPGYPKYSAATGALIKDSAVIAYLPDQPNPPPCTLKGMVLPLDQGYLVDGIAFINFDGALNDGDTCAAIGTVEIVCTCTHFCAGYNYKFRNVRWVNSDHRAYFRWEHQAELEDLDGSLTGAGAGARALPAVDYLPAGKCTQRPEWSSHFPGVVCEGGANAIDLIRFTFNQIQPESLKFKALKVSNRFGESSVPYWPKREKYVESWMMMLLAGEEHTLYFVDAPHLNNISYVGEYFGVEEGQYVIVTHNVTQAFSDIAVTDPKDIRDHAAIAPLSYASDNSWAYYFDQGLKHLSYIISDRPNPDGEASIDRMVMLQALDCDTGECGTVGEEEDLTVDTRPPEDDTRRWSDAAIWEDGPPTEGSDVTIPEDWWLVVDTSLPKMKTLIIEGTLEFENDGDFVLEATYIVIRGGRLLAGWADAPFRGTLQIILHGTHASPDFPPGDGPTIGSRVLASFGALELHGQPSSVTWTRLSATARAGDTQLTLETGVDWQVGHEILIATTGYSAWETEKRTLTAVSGSTLTLDRPLSYTHLGVSETIPSPHGSFTYKMAAEVALLTRNIRIQGADYTWLEQQSYGARVLVGVQTTLADDMSIRVLKGYANLSNVEFYHSGQEGWNSDSDARFSVTFMRLGRVTETHPSGVSHCSFHDGFSTAIGVYATDGLVLDNNVIHHTVGEGIFVTGTDVMLQRNLVTLTLFSGTYQERYEPENELWPAGIDVRNATRVVLQNNVVAGSERAGFRTDGQSCFEDIPAERRWHGNVAHSVLIGVFMFFVPDFDCQMAEGCSLLTDFMVYKAYNYGFYAQTTCSLKLKDFVMVDNSISFLPAVLYPSPLDHEFAKKDITIEGGLVVGLSPHFDCSSDMLPEDSDNLMVAETGMAWTLDETRKWQPGDSKHGRMALAWPLFLGRDNMAPSHAFHSQQFEPALYGITYVTGVTFAHFQKTCGEKYDKVFVTNPIGYDVQFPIEVEGLSFVDVHDKAKAFYVRPDLWQVKERDCGDMDCDGHKKAMVKDRDGSLLGHQGAVMADSAFEWNGDPRRGMGDYKIPKAMATGGGNKRLAYSDVYRHIGIIGTDDNRCQWQPDWLAFDCRTIDYEFLILESLDMDAFHRRVGPLAIRGDGYLDLVNGPRAVGICHGYPCTDRLSVFYTILGSGQHYDAYFTGTNPSHLRIHFPYAADDTYVVLGIYYGSMQRVDVYHNDVTQADDVIIDKTTYMLPENAEKLPSGKLQYGTAPSREQFTQDARGRRSGTNYLDLETETIQVVVKGSGIIDLVMEPVIILGFNMPTMTAEEFYDGDNLINNLAAFLGVPKSKIRVMNVVRESSGTGRKRRATSGYTVRVEIGNHPADDGSDQLDFLQLLEMSNSLKSAMQQEELGGILEVVVTDVYLYDPVPPNSGQYQDEWQEYLELREQNSNPRITLTVPDQMILVDKPVPGKEGLPFTMQPKIKFVDTDGDLIPVLNTMTGSRWAVQASLSVPAGGGDPQARLLGSTKVFVEGGWANFSSLAISHSGPAYALSFRVVDPDIFTNVLSTYDLYVYQLPLVAVVEMPTVASRGQPFSVQVHLEDRDSRQTINNVYWKGHTWSCVLGLSDLIDQNNTLSGPRDASFGLASGVALFDGLSLGDHGHYVIHVTVTSDPPHFNFSSLAVIAVAPSAGGDDSDLDEVEEVATTVQLKFDADFSTIADKEVVFAVALHNRLRLITSGVTLEVSHVWPGSIKTNFTVQGTEAATIEAVEAIGHDVKHGEPIRFGDMFISYGNEMLVDDVVYGELDGAPTTWRDPNKKRDIIVGVCVGLACLVLIILIVVVACYFSKKAKKNADKGSTSSRERLQNSTLSLDKSGNIVHAEKGLENKACVAGPSIVTGNQTRQEKERYVKGEATRSGASVGGSVATGSAAPGSAAPASAAPGARSPLTLSGATLGGSAVNGAHSPPPSYQEEQAPADEMSETSSPAGDDDQDGSFRQWEGGEEAGWGAEGDDLGEEDGEVLVVSAPPAYSGYDNSAPAGGRQRPGTSTHRKPRPGTSLPATQRPGTVPERKRPGTSLPQRPSTSVRHDNPLADQPEPHLVRVSSPGQAWGQDAASRPPSAISRQDSRATVSIGGRERSDSLVLGTINN